MRQHSGFWKEIKRGYPRLFEYTRCLSPEKRQAFFGLGHKARHPIRHRLRARADNPSIGAGSPFNIKAKSFFLPTFSREEVCGLLDQHTHATGQVFSAEVFEKLYACSGGQPWLTNALAYEIVAEMLQND